MRVKFKISNDEYELESLEKEYLFSYFLRFDCINNTELSENNIKVELSDKMLGLFYECIYIAFQELLDDCYIEPSLKERQKHPTFFERFYYKDKKYTVNYTTSKIGLLIYVLHIRLTILKNAINSGDTLYITN